ncbi:hypothetical protein C0J52_00131 [Blattella germanica]|nr:hypothetical protein C0J52_00131 [Blattella germanica]
MNKVQFSSTTNAPAQHIFANGNSLIGPAQSETPVIKAKLSSFMLGKSFSLDDDPRPGRPIELSTPENVAAIEKAIKGDRRITHRQLEEHLRIPVSTLPAPANANPLHSAAEVRGALLVLSS